MLAATFLLWHSVYKLATNGKYNDNTPVWLKIYVLFVSVFIFLAPCSIVYGLLSRFDLDNITSAITAGLVGGLFFIVFLIKTPKPDTSKADTF
jgi:uncharacterized membrane protein